jgi:hypothetical protein
MHGPTVGMAVLFTVPDDINESAFRQFLLTHSHLVEHEMRLLQGEIQFAIRDKPRFFHLVYKVRQLRPA